MKIIKSNRTNEKITLNNFKKGSQESAQMSTDNSIEGLIKSQNFASK